MPIAIRGDKRIGLFGTPAVAPIRAHRSVVLKNRIDDRPSSLHRVLAGKKRPVTGHRRPQQSLVRRFLSGLLVRQVKFSLTTHEFLSRQASSASHRGLYIADRWRSVPPLIAGKNGSRNAEALEAPLEITLIWSSGFDD